MTLSSKALSEILIVSLDVLQKPQDLCSLFVSLDRAYLQSYQPAKVAFPHTGHVYSVISMSMYFCLGFSNFHFHFQLPF